VIIVCLVQREIKEGEILIDERKEKRRRWEIIFAIKVYKWDIWAQSLASVYKMWSYYNPNSIFGWNNS
jgi:hypothetical protein